MASVTWSPDSLADLEQIVRDLARESSQAAERLSEDIIATSDRLSEYPYLGRIFLYANREDTRVLIVRNHRLIYRVQHGDVEITRILHGPGRLDPLICFSNRTERAYTLTVE